MKDPAKTLAQLENIRVCAKESRVAFEKGPPTKEIAKELGLPPPLHDDATIIAQAAWFERVATRAIVRLSEKVGVEPMGVYRDLPVRRNRKAPPRG
jgi:hypothetical protein